MRRMAFASGAIWATSLEFFHRHEYGMAVFLLVLFGATALMAADPAKLLR